MRPVFSALFLFILAYPATAQKPDAAMLGPAQRSWSGELSDQSCQRARRSRCCRAIQRSRRSSLSA